MSEFTYLFRGREISASRSKLSRIIPVKGWGKSPGQDRRRLLSEARAGLPLVFGTMVNSSAVTFESST